MPTRIALVVAVLGLAVPAVAVAAKPKSGYADVNGVPCTTRSTGAANP